jgi:hypothetical protein
VSELANRYVRHQQRVRDRLTAKLLGSTWLGGG